MVDALAYRAMHRLILRIATTALAALAFSTAQAVEVRAMRLSTTPRNTRIVLDLSARAAHHVSVLHQPERVVLELKDTHLGTAAHSPAIGGTVKQMHLSQSRTGDLRLALEVDQAVRLKTTLLGGKGRASARLVLDLSTAAMPPARRLVASIAAAPMPVPATSVSATLSSPPVKVAHAPRDARDLIIAIDAGHGGEDPGAIGKNGTREKDVTLAIARELAAKVDAEPGLRAVLTRNADYFVPLRERMQRARVKQADLFVSIHADAVRDRSIEGASVYILSPHGASNEASRWLADRENAADLIGGVSLDDKSNVLASVLLDLSQSAALNASQDAADRVLAQLSHAGEVHRRQVQQAGFMVLKSPDIPSMLVETAYISNPLEESRLKTRPQQARIAASILQGLHDYFYANPPVGTRIAALVADTHPVLATAGAGGTGN